MPTGVYARPSAEERFWSKVERTSSCWNWIGAIQGGGYGNFYHLGRYVGAHRFSYELLVGDVPTGLQVDHLCRNRRCVNPEHLEPVTQRDNLLRGETVVARNAGKTQ